MEEEDNNYFPTQMPMNYGGNSLSSEGALQYQFESGGVIEVLERIMQGKELIEDPRTGKKIYKQVTKPMINQLGMAKIKGFLTTFLSSAKIFALTDVNDEYIGDSVISIGEVLVKDLEDNWERYGIKDDASASFIVNIVTDLAYSIKRKGESATYLKFLTKTHNVSEIQHHQSLSQQNNNPMQRQGIIGKILGRR
jgi:hypothetical protein